MRNQNTLASSGLAGPVFAVRSAFRFQCGLAMCARGRRAQSWAVTQLGAPPRRGCSWASPQIQKLLLLSQPFTFLMGTQTPGVSIPPQDEVGVSLGTPRSRVSHLEGIPRGLSVAPARLRDPCEHLGVQPPPEQMSLVTVALFFQQLFVWCPCGVGTGGITGEQECSFHLDPRSLSLQVPSWLLSVRPHAGNTPPLPWQVACSRFRGPDRALSNCPPKVMF